MRVSLESPGLGSQSYEVPDFVLVTGNPNKRREVERILGVEIDVVDVDLPELQSDDLLEVLRAKADTAWREVGRPLVVEETGLSLRALNGFPGPLVKWMLKSVGAEGIAQVAADAGDRTVEAVCALEYRDSARRVLGEGRTGGRLVLPPRGEGGFGWDPVFEVDVEADGRVEPWTYAELGDEVKDVLAHRGRAWRDLLARLSSP